MFQYYIDFWRGYVDFSGKATRSQFWYATAMNILIYLLMMLCLLMMWVVGISFSASSEVMFGFMMLTLVLYALLAWAFNLAILLPTLAITVRRLRDAGYHWGLIFLNLVPVVGSFVLLIFMCLPTNTDENNVFENGDDEAGERVEVVELLPASNDSIEASDKEKEI